MWFRRSRAGAWGAKRPEVPLDARPPKLYSDEWKSILRSGIIAQPSLSFSFRSVGGENGGTLRLHSILTPISNIELEWGLYGSLYSILAKQFKSTTGLFALKDAPRNAKRMEKQQPVADLGL